MRSVRDASMVLALFALVAVAACSSEDTTTDPVVTEGPWASLEERPCPDASFLTWENFGEPFMRSWCTGCHASTLPDSLRAMAPVEVDLDSRDAVVQHLERVWFRAADQNATMPPAGGPGLAERELLGEWLACGAPMDADMIAAAR